MKIKFINTLAILCLGSFIACSQNSSDNQNNESTKSQEIDIEKELQPHTYGGWYCPDNLNGFPAVDIKNWKNVPVVNGRMPTQEEAQNGTSLIFVDPEKYPHAKPLDITLPKLARFYNHNSGKNELIIVIQASNISNDSIVGFRYLNGGNGSARLDEIQLLSDDEIGAISDSRFVTLKIDIDASKSDIWEVLTKDKYSQALQVVFDPKNMLSSDWSQSSKVNFNYLHAGDVTSAFAGNLFGNQYAQIDYEKIDYQYVEKFLVSENTESNQRELHIVCGPYAEDFATQKLILQGWGEKVKVLSEKIK